MTGFTASSSSPVRAVLMLLVCMFAWGSVFPVAKHVLLDMNALSLAFWRFAIASVSLLLYMLWLGQALPTLSARRLAIACTVSIIGAGGLNLGLFTGLQLTAAANGALIMSLSPVMTALMASLVARKLPGAALSFSIVCGLLGVSIVITNGDFDHLLAMNLNRGDLYIFCGMLAWSFYTLASQYVSRWLPLVPFTMLSMIAGALTMGIACLVTAGVHPWNELMQLNLPSQSAVLYIGLFATVAGYLLWLNGVRTIGPARAALFMNFVPVFAALVAELMGQHLTLMQVLGIAVVLGGMLLPVLFKHAQKRIVQQQA
ncbi:MAG: DMT family transporter [Oleibacter sp.]|nr:DMT family transporter [Thalassolituus sp.]